MLYQFGTEFTSISTHPASVSPLCSFPQGYHPSGSATSAQTPLVRSLVVNMTVDGMVGDLLQPRDSGDG
ncbi:hypothetical protein PAPYR_13187 [Paratrimastix pyriformis]|uniref:Uncharacterized protein n=1 Tax=Paratrimastix pyriformis TaxID=342808 RepID=A0ABQ8U0R1_9EUKA|nr:hypothetical protein PAPYR_13187 [Paratrimastix pyriformis]